MSYFHISNNVEIVEVRQVAVINLSQLAGILITQYKLLAMKIARSPRILYWGWLRLAVGVIQMACSAYAAFLIFQVGFQPATWEFIVGAIAATAISRLLYRGEPDPKLDTRINDGRRET